MRETVPPTVDDEAAVYSSNTAIYGASLPVMEAMLRFTEAVLTSWGAAPTLPNAVWLPGPPPPFPLALKSGTDAVCRTIRVSSTDAVCGTPRVSGTDAGSTGRVYVERGSEQTVPGGTGRCEINPENTQPPSNLCQGRVFLGLVVRKYTTFCYGATECVVLRQDMAYGRCRGGGSTTGTSYAIAHTPLPVLAMPRRYA